MLNLKQITINKVRFFVVDNSIKVKLIDGIIIQISKNTVLYKPKNICTDLNFRTFLSYVFKNLV